MKKFWLLSSISIIILAGSCLAATSCLLTSASFSLYDSFSNSHSSTTMASSSFKNSISLGQTAMEKSSSPSFRDYPGFQSNSMAIVDTALNFMDESPTSSVLQNTTHVTCAITVQTSSGNAVASAKYRISNSGTSDSSFSTWQTDVSTAAIYSGSKIRFQVSVPNVVGSSFTQSANNYIQWEAKSSGGLESFSGMYNIAVSTNAGPAITILQPDAKSGFASVKPMVQATITNILWGIDPNSIILTFNSEDGTKVSVIKSVDYPNIYDASKNLLTYKYDQPDLVPEKTYTLIVTATDKSGMDKSASVTFKVKGGAIADLVPYPSPFDPKVQPVKIRYVLNKDAEVSVNIYDMARRLVKNVLDNSFRVSGICEEQWTGVNYAGEVLANGVYFCEIVAKDEDGEHRRYIAFAIFGK